MQRALLSLAAICSACSLSACSEVPVDTPSPEELEPVVLSSSAKVSLAPAFADQSGGGMFLDPDGVIFRLRADGTFAGLEAYPPTNATGAPVKALYPLGPHAAVLAGEGGPRVAQSGWVSSPGWTTALEGAGITGAADSIALGSWLAHQRGLFRLIDGELFELKSGGGSLDGISAIAHARGETGASAVWFARNGALYAAELYDNQVLIRPSSLEAEDVGEIVSLASLSAGPSRPRELWVLGERGLFRHGLEGWRKIDLGAPAEELVTAGRWAWVRAGSQLFVHDAELQRWSRVSGQDANADSFLAAEASGTLWRVRDGTAHSVSVGQVLRVHGLDEGGVVTLPELKVSARLPPGTSADAVEFTLAGQTVRAPGPNFSFGGIDIEGHLQGHSLSGLSPGDHVLELTATLLGGGVATRRIPFEYRPSPDAIPSFERDIRPIHEARCAKCHTEGPGFPLTSYETWKENGERIASAVSQRRMPADGPLDPVFITAIQRWVSSGAQP